MRCGGDTTINTNPAVTLPDEPLQGQNPVGADQQPIEAPPSGQAMTLAAAEAMASLDLIQNEENASQYKDAYKTFFNEWQERLQSGQFDSTRAIFEDIWEDEADARTGIAMLCGYHGAWQGEEYMPADISSALNMYGGSDLTLTDLVLEEENPDPQTFRENLHRICVNGNEETKNEVAAVAGVYQASPAYSEDMTELLDIEFLERGAFVTIRDNLRGFTAPENIILVLAGYGMARLTTKMILARLIPYADSELSVAGRVGKLALESVIESGAFNFFTKGFADIMGADVDWSPKTFLKDWASLAICFGALRLVGVPLSLLRNSMSRSALFNPAGARPVTIGGRTLPVLNSTGETIMGIAENLGQTGAFYLGDKIAYVANLNEMPSTFLEDWLTLLQFGAAIKISDRLSNSWLNKNIYRIQNNAARQAAQGRTVTDGAAETTALPEGACFESAVAEYETTRNSPERAALHKEIVAELLQQGETSENPQLIFTAGPFGAGKSTVINALTEAGLIDTQRFMKIDPDQIKEMIPEYGELKQLNRSQAATTVHPESGDLQGIAFFRALEMNKNMIVDGSLRHADYFSEVINKIRIEHPNYNISIIYVDAGESTLLDRVVSRAVQTGRAVPESLVIDCKNQVHSAVEQLKQLVDSEVVIINESNPFIESFFSNGENTPLNYTIPMPGTGSQINYPWSIASQFSDDSQETSDDEPTFVSAVLGGVSQLFQLFTS